MLYLTVKDSYVNLKKKTLNKIYFKQHKILIYTSKYLFIFPLCKPGAQQVHVNGATQLFRDQHDQLPPGQEVLRQSEVGLSRDI